MATENTREREREAAIKKAKKNKRKRKLKSRIVISVLLALALVTTVITLSLTVFFNINEILVEGNKSYSADEIIDSAEISVGDNLFRISCDTAEKQIEQQLPYIKDIEFKRFFPDALKLVVTETKDQICIVKGNELYTADFDGKVLSKVDAYDEKLIKMKVSDKTEVKIGKNIKFASERETELFEFYLGAISEYNWDVDMIDVSEPYESYFRFEDRLIVKFGSTLYFDQKLSYFSAGIKNISSDAVGIFDLSEWTPENRTPVLRQQDISEYNF